MVGGGGGGGEGDGDDGDDDDCKVDAVGKIEHVLSRVIFTPNSHQNYPPHQPKIS